MTKDPQLDRPAIELTSVIKRYGSTTAVDGISLSVSPKEIFAFLGPNGAGKTTTIKMITGLLRADEGQVLVCGQNMHNNGMVAKRRIAYVPDQPFLYDKLTGREFLCFVARMYDVSEATRDRILDDLTHRFDMRAFLDQMTESYSHGMKQKVVLASAFIHEPDVLVIDEPMVGLDPKTVREVKDLFVEHTARGGCVFMCTHTLEVAEAIADRIGIINKGQLVALGSMAELRDKAHQEHSLEEIFLHLTQEKDGFGDGC